MKDNSPYTIGAQVQTPFDSDRCAPDENRYVFDYTIKLHHAGVVPARLSTHHWVMADAKA